MADMELLGFLKDSLTRTGPRSEFRQSGVEPFCEIPVSGARFPFHPIVITATTSSIAPVCRAMQPNAWFPMHFGAVLAGEFT